MILDFSSPEVIDACNQLQGPFGPGTDDKKLWPPFERFMKCAQYLYLEFLNVATQDVPARVHPKLP
jgi:hypothetical protein